MNMARQNSVDGSHGAPRGNGTLSRSLIERLYSYYLLTRRAEDQGATHISSRQLAENLSIGDTQVRKDMAAIQIVGLPKRGYDVELTIEALRRAMGLEQTNHAVVCGVGNLGRALLEYSRFTDFGFRIAGAFDVRPDVVGQNIANTRVLHIEHLGKLIEMFGVEIGVITANVWAAQSLCDEMVKHGVKAIWNFAPIHLIAPEDVLVRSEDFAGSLAVISHHLRHSGGGEEE